MNRPIRLAINGYGRIGRCVLRALYESPLRHRYRIVAINEPSDLDSMVYLTRFDSTHGVFPGHVELDGEGMLVNGQAVQVMHERCPEAIDWSALEIDMLIECSGQYSTRDQLQRFIDAGCPRLLLSHPGRSAEDVDATVVYGINETALTGTERIVSNASCTTNAIVPILNLLHRKFGLEHAFLTTLHSVMNDQPVIDGYHSTDLRRTRSAMQSIVPVSTGLARGVERLLPQLAGRIQAKAIRVPTLNVSAIDIMAALGEDVSADELNIVMQEAAVQSPTLLTYSNQPHASIDFNHNPHSAIIDGSQTRTSGPRLINMMVWFDNEWGFANRLLDVAEYWSQRITGAMASPTAAAYSSH